MTKKIGLGFGLFGILALGCSSGAPSSAHAGAAESTGSTGYFVAAGDFSPANGNGRVYLAEQDQTVCANGESADACKADEVDFSSLGLGDASNAALKTGFANGDIVVHGSLTKSVRGIPEIQIGVLVVDAAYVGLTNTEIHDTPRGHYYEVTQKGIARVNDESAAAPQSVTWSEIEASPSTKAQQKIDAGETVLIFGNGRTHLHPTEVYTKVETPSDLGVDEAIQHYVPRMVSAGWAPGCGAFMPGGQPCYTGATLTFTKQYADLKVTVSPKVDAAKKTVTITLDTWSESLVHSRVAVRPETQELGDLGLAFSTTYTVSVVDYQGKSLYDGSFGTFPAP
jgi:hypothetical protein